LVYESNVASCRLWDSLGFKRIGRVPGGGQIKSQPGEFVDAIIYGRGLSLDGEDSVSQDRFEKIRYYLKHSKYPRGADRAEKSRLRSAATHYKLLGGEEEGEPERLMLKDKEVVSDPQQQYDIAQEIHMKQHAGINKTTAAIATKYHWVRIKETVNRVIRDCPQCKETLKAPPIPGTKDDDRSPSETMSGMEMESTIEEDEKEEPVQISHEMDEAPDEAPNYNSLLHQPVPTAVPENVHPMAGFPPVPLDPQMMQIHQQLRRYQQQNPMGQFPHGTHNVDMSNFDDAMRYHTANNAYQLMVGEAPDLFPQDMMGMVNPQAHDLHHDPELLNKFEYGSPSDGNYDFT
jgi:hypothetical protein